MDHFAIVVTITLKPGMAEDFRRHILENAAAAKRDEPGCHRFDVLIPEEDSGTFLFYEEYTDTDAFEAHRQAPHFKKYWAATEDMVAERAIVRCAVIS
jgi:quinol monooxygenase YgiN